MLLTRVGEFYETYGVDAVMMMQHAGLNRMGQEVRAGCPRKNIQQTLDGLTGAGLTVAVYEEVRILLQPLLLGVKNVDQSVHARYGS